MPPNPSISPALPALPRLRRHKAHPGAHRAHDRLRPQSRRRGSSLQRQAPPEDTRGRETLHVRQRELSRMGPSLSLSRSRPRRREPGHTCMKRRNGIADRKWYRRRATVTATATGRITRSLSCNARVRALSKMYVEHLTYIRHEPIYINDNCHDHNHNHIGSTTSIHRHTR